MGDRANVCVFCASAATAERLGIVAEIRESLELSQGSDYVGFLRAFCQPLLRLLQTVLPSTADAPEQRLRVAALEVCTRCAVAVLCPGVTEGLLDYRFADTCETVLL